VIKVSTIINRLRDLIIRATDVLSSIIGIRKAVTIEEQTMSSISNSQDLLMQNIMAESIAILTETSISHEYEVKISEVYPNTISELKPQEIKSSHSCGISSVVMPSILSGKTAEIMSTKQATIQNTISVSIANILGQITVLTDYVTENIITWIIVLLSSFGLPMKDYANIRSNESITIRQQEI